MGDCLKTQLKEVVNNSDLKKMNEFVIDVIPESVFTFTYINGTSSVRSSGITFIVNDAGDPVSSLSLPSVGSGEESSRVKLSSFSGNGKIFIKTNTRSILNISSRINIDFSELTYSRLYYVYINDEPSGLVKLGTLPEELTSLIIYGSIEGDANDFKKCLNLVDLSASLLKIDLLDLARVQIAAGRTSASITSTTAMLLKASFNNNVLAPQRYTLYWEQSGQNYIVSVKQKDASEALYSVTI